MLPLGMLALLVVLLGSCAQGPETTGTVAGTDYLDEAGRRWTVVGPARVDDVPTLEERGLPLEDEALEQDEALAALSLEEVAENLRPVMMKDGVEYILAEPDLALALQVLDGKDEILVQPGSAAEGAGGEGLEEEPSDGLAPLVIIDSDNRSLRLNNTQTPWKSHVYISSNQGNCSGTMIGSRTILTSAHCVRSGSGAVKAGLTFRPGVNGGNGANWAPYGRYRWSVPSGQSREVCALWWPSGYNSSSPVRYDYAVVRLCNNPGVNYWHGYGSFPGHQLQGMSIWLFGYPAEDIPNYVQYPQIFGMGCSIRERYVRSIHYRCDVTGGQSGTGVYHIFNNADGRVIVGVNKGGYGNHRNRATRITNEVFNFIQNNGF